MYRGALASKQPNAAVFRGTATRGYFLLPNTVPYSVDGTALLGLFRGHRRRVPPYNYIYYRIFHAWVPTPGAITCPYCSVPYILGTG